MRLSSQQRIDRSAPSWLQRDVTLNWLALGLLLAAWNAADDTSIAPPRPQPLQSHPYVTVRAVARVAGGDNPWAGLSASL